MQLACIRQRAVKDIVTLSVSIDIGALRRVTSFMLVKPPPSPPLSGRGRGGSPQMLAYFGR